MDLLEWIEKHKYTKKEFCERAGISTMTLYNILNGRMPYSRIVDKITEATYGRVKYKDLNNIKKKADKKTDRNECSDDRKGNLGKLNQTFDDLLNDFQHKNP